MSNGISTRSLSDVDVVASKILRYVCSVINVAKTNRKNVLEGRLCERKVI